MLMMFRVNNYASFRDDAVLDMRKSTIREYSDHVIKEGNYELLKTLAIYGPNASGKSNLISAIATFADIVKKQLFIDDYDATDNQNEVRFPLEPFLFSDEKNNSIEFEIVFINRNKFQYGFSINEGVIESEWLEIDNKSVFDRNLSKITSSNSYEKEINKMSKVHEKRLYIGIIDYYLSDGKLREQMDFFKDFFINQLNVHFEIIFEGTVKGRINGIRLSKELEKNKVFRTKVSKFLNAIDAGIEEIILDDEHKIVGSAHDEDTRPVFKTGHKVFNRNNEFTRMEYMDLKYESSGTLRFLSYIQEILLMMDKGVVFIVDELSSRLHPILTRFIVEMFQTVKNDKSQLIFTTHDLSLMNKNQFRRDEIAIVSKDESGVSSICALSDYKVRKDATYSKDYLNGKFGGIPVIDYSILDGGN